jgi:hypothetical protein
MRRSVQMRIYIWKGAKGKLRSPLALLAVLSVLLTACGSAHKPSASTSQTTTVESTQATSTTTSVAIAAAKNGRLLGDEDDDDPGSPASSSGNDSDADSDSDSPTLESKAYHDSDDRADVTWGRRASASEARVATALVKRYYADAAAGDGAKACLLIYTLFAEAIPEDYGQPPGPPALRGKSCAVVMTKLFAQEHERLLADSASMRVTGVRVLGNQGRVLLGFTTTPASYLLLHKQRGGWRISGTIAVALP